MSFVRAIATAPLRVYQRVISPFKPAMCRFSPTCSQYAIEAVEQHGVVRGGLYAAWRILRCNPLCKGGHDAVPLRTPRAAHRPGDASHRPDGTSTERRTSGL